MPLTTHNRKRLILAQKTSDDITEETLFELALERRGSWQA